MFNQLLHTAADEAVCQEGRAGEGEGVAAAANHTSGSSRGDTRAFLPQLVVSRSCGRTPSAKTCDKMHCESVSTAARRHFAFVSARSWGNAIAYITDFAAILMTFFFFASEIQSENGTRTIIFYDWYCNETSLSWRWMMNACRLQQ